jgi:hypothetical protein
VPDPFSLLQISAAGQPVDEDLTVVRRFESLVVLRHDRAIGGLHASQNFAHAHGFHFGESGQAFVRAAGVVATGIDTVGVDDGFGVGFVSVGRRCSGGFLIIIFAAASGEDQTHERDRNQAKSQCFHNGNSSSVKMAIENVRAFHGREQVIAWVFKGLFATPERNFPCPAIC